MKPGKPSLEIDRVGRADRTVGGELDRGALYERAGRHDHVAVVAGHRPGLGDGVAVDRSGRLDAAAEGDDRLGRAELDRLDDIVAFLFAVRDRFEAERLIETGGENRALERAGNNRRREEETLIERGQNAEVRPDLPAETGRAEAAGAKLDIRFFSADVAADRRKTAAGVFDQRTDRQIGAEGSIVSTNSP